MSVEKLFTGDQRCEAILNHVMAILYSEAEGMPIPTVIGVLELAKKRVMDEAE